MEILRFRGRDGLDLAYRDVGSGRPLILLHGFMGAGEHWIDGGDWLDRGPAAGLVERGFHLLAPDLRGHGASAAPHDPAAYPPDVLADDGLAFLEHLGLGAGDYDLAGYSFGSRIAIRMLARGAEPGRAIAAGQGLAKVSGLQGGGANERVLAALVDGAPLVPGSPEAGMAAWIERSGADPCALLHVLRSSIPTPEDQLAEISTPTLVVIGDRDERSDADQLAELLPAGRFASVPGNHETAFGSPEFAAELEAFLSDRADRRPPRSLGG